MKRLSNNEKIDELKIRLEEAEQTIEAIRNGYVDALIDTTGKTTKIFTIQGAETAYRIMVDTMNEGAMTLDSDGTVMYVNERAAKMLELSPSDIIGKSVDRLINVEYIKRFRSIFEEAAGGNRAHCDVNLLKKKGALFPGYVSLAPLYLDGKTNICMLISDLTERKTAEERLWKLNSERQLKAQLKTVLENISDGVVVFSPDGKLIEFNSTALKFWNVASRPRSGSKYKEIIKYFKVFDVEGNEVPFEKWPYSLSRAGNAFTNIEYHVKDQRNNLEQYLLFSASPIYDGKNNIRYIVLSFHDITEQKKNQLALKKSKQDAESKASELSLLNKELETFSYSVAHDLRNPLKVINGCIDFIIEDCSGQLTNECNDYLVRIRDGIGRMNSIIDDILALSKISRQELAITKVNISEMAHLSINELMAANPDRKVGVKIQEGLKANVDARLMSVALGNLLSNSWKFTQKVEHAQIEFGSMEKDGRRIYYVKDNGAGFDMKQAERLFKPFQRLHTQKEFAGTGVGLAIVERAISRHGGNVWAESEPGKGAVFYFTLKA